MSSLVLRFLDPVSFRVLLERPLRPPAGRENESLGRFCWSGSGDAVLTVVMTDDDGATTVADVVDEAKGFGCFVVRPHIPFVLTWKVNPLSASAREAQAADKAPRGDIDVDVEVDLEIDDGERALADFLKIGMALGLSFGAGLAIIGLAVSGFIALVGWAGRALFG